jgi:signal peptidase II
MADDPAARSSADAAAPASPPVDVAAAHEVSSAEADPSSASNASMSPAPSGESAASEEQAARSPIDPSTAPLEPATPEPLANEAPAAVALPRPSIVFLAVVSALSLALDLGSKAWAKAKLDDPSDIYRRIDVVKDHVAFVFAKNKGGAWGLLQDENESLRRPFFVLISIAAVVFIVSLYRKLTPQQIALKWGLPLVLGGALGNLVDRVRYGHVVDFIDVYIKASHWPTFNVADVAICVGVGLMAVDMFTSRAPAKARAAAERANDG